MRVSDVDINVIYQLLKSVPEGMEITGIDLTHGYELKLIAGVEEINKLEYENGLEELTGLIEGINSKTKSIRRVR